MELEGGGGQKDPINKRVGDWVAFQLIALSEQDREFFDKLKEVPKVNKFLGCLCFLLNVVIPGSGTVFAALFEQGAETISKMQLITGVTQLITAFWIIGWVVSIFWGYLIVKVAFRKEEETVEGKVQAKVEEALKT